MVTPDPVAHSARSTHLPLVSDSNLTIDYKHTTLHHQAAAAQSSSRSAHHEQMSGRTRLSPRLDLADDGACRRQGLFSTVIHRDVGCRRSVLLSPAATLTIHNKNSASQANDDVACKHGPSECLGNMIELCAADVYPNPKTYLGFTMCLTRQYARIPDQDLVEDCALEHGVDFDRVNDCMSRDEDYGLKLLRESVLRTEEVGVTTSCTVRGFLFLSEGFFSWDGRVEGGANELYRFDCKRRLGVSAMVESGRTVREGIGSRISFGILIVCIKDDDSQPAHVLLYNIAPRDLLTNHLITQIMN